MMKPFARIPCDNGWEYESKNDHTLITVSTVAWLLDVG